MINTIDHIKLLFRKDKELYISLYQILGFFPHNISLYRQALAHSSSSLREKNGKKINNERLEFLGDAIIEAVTSDIVYRHFEKKREGFLTTTRSKLVQRNTLNKLAEDTGLDKLISSNGHNTGHNNYIGGNAFEALVGAVYLDRGYKACLWFLRRRIIAEHLNLDNVAKKEVNFKSKLLEWAQKNRLATNFSVDSTQQKNGKPATFHSEVIIEEIVCGRGDGFSKKESQQNAAKEALSRLRRDKTSLDAVLKSKEKRTAIEQEIISLPPAFDTGENNAPRQSNKPHRHTSRPKREPAQERQAVSSSQGQTNSAAQRTKMRQKPRNSTDKATSRENLIDEAEAKAFAPQQ